MSKGETPAKDYRMDLRVPRDLSKALEKERQDVTVVLGRKVTKSEIVLGILEQYFSSK